MSLMSRYLNQLAVYREVDSSKDLDIYGEPEYLEEKNLKCRREFSDREVEDRAGHIVQSRYTYLLDTTAKPKIGDLIDGLKILEVVDYVNGAGRLIGWEVHA
jgi:hypothetical protein